MATLTNLQFVQNLSSRLWGRTGDAALVAEQARQLDNGYITRPWLLDQYLTSPAYDQSLEAVSRLYFAAFNRNPDHAGLLYWHSVFRNGASLNDIAQIVAYSPEFASSFGALDNGAFTDLMYSNVLGRAADAPGRAYWTGTLTAGATRGSVVNAFAQSAEHQAENATKTRGIAAFAVAAGRAPTNAEIAAFSGSSPSDLAVLAVAADGTSSSQAKALTYSALTMTESSANDGTISTVLELTLTGATFAGTIGATRGTVTLTPGGLTGSILKTGEQTAELTLTGTAKDHSAAGNVRNMTVTFKDADFSGALANAIIGSVRSNIAVSFTDIVTTVTSGILSSTDAIGGAIILDLATDTFTYAGRTVTPAAGTLASATGANFSGLTLATGAKLTSGVVFRGDAAANTYTATALGDTITGREGSDTITLGAGVDKLVFENSATANGADTITGFKVGKGGDVLNFAAFLGSTGTSNIGIADTADAADVNLTWSNGNVLFVQGNSIDSIAEVAALFGDTFAAPTRAAKAVIITSDIIGDASIWYLTNAGDAADLATISADEVELVGTLKNVNNFQIVPFLTANLA